MVKPGSSFLAIRGKQVTDIYNGGHFFLAYRDTDHAPDTFYFTREDAMFRAAEINGDTAGNDIGNCTSDDAYLSLYGNLIWVLVE